jgi:hypothetical protein
MWNYRIVNVKSENGGDDWYCLQEVYYNKEGKPYGFCNPCMGSETYETMQGVLKMMQEATLLPPLQEEDINASAR